MAETLTMSTKERQRLQVIGRIHHRDTTVAAAAESLQISERQMYRLLRRHKKDGDEGIIHRLRGKTSNSGYDRCVRSHVLKLYQERYSDYGPTLFSEVLSENHQITIDSDTLRRWLKEAKFWNGAGPLDSTVKNVPGGKPVVRSCSSTAAYTTGLKVEDRSVVSWWPLMMPPEKSSFAFQGLKTRQMSSGYSRVTSSAMGSLSSSTLIMAPFTTINITVKPMSPVPSNLSALS